MKRFLRFSIVLLFFLTWQQIHATTIPTIKREFRGVWISTVYCLDWPCTSTGNALQGTSSSVVAQQKQSLCAILTV